MTIQFTAQGECELKTKTATVVLNDVFRINEFEAPGPGEYEVSEVFAEVGPNVTHLHIEDMIVAAFSKTQRAVTPEELENLENVDIMLVTFGGNVKEELEKITKLIGSVEPRVVVLCGLDDPTLVEKIEGQVPEQLPLLKISKCDLPDDERKVYLLATR